MTKTFGDLFVRWFFLALSRHWRTPLVILASRTKVFHVHITSLHQRWHNTNFESLQTLCRSTLSGSTRLFGPNMDRFVANFAVEGALWTYVRTKPGHIQPTRESRPIFVDVNKVVFMIKFMCTTFFVQRFSFVGIYHPYRKQAYLLSQILDASLRL